MATPEGRVKARVKKMLKSYDTYQHWPVQTGYGAACLDCHGCHNGMYFAIETKAPGKHPTPRQEATMADVNAARGAVFVIGEAETGDKQYPYSGMEELDQWLSAHS